MQDIPKSQVNCATSLGSSMKILRNGSVFHILCWSSQGSRHPAESTVADDILAATEAFDENVQINKFLLHSLDTKSRQWPY